VRTILLLFFEHPVHIFFGINLLKKIREDNNQWPVDMDVEWGCLGFIGSVFHALIRCITFLLKRPTNALGCLIALLLHSIRPYYIRILVLATLKMAMSFMSSVQWVAWCSFPGGRTHSPPCNTKVKNGWSYTATVLVCSYGMDRGTFILTLFCCRPRCRWSWWLWRRYFCHCLGSISLYFSCFVCHQKCNVKVRTFEIYLWGMIPTASEREIW